MFRLCRGRAGHYALLFVTCAALYLPNLGGPSLWDIDEGNNSACARTMLDSGEYVVPYFNGALRPDKPALLYWLQAGAYRAFGVNEFAARLPSALAALVAVLAAYELGRVMFDAATGLLGGLVLASATMFSAAAHFANPDALLSACAVLTFLGWWQAFRAGGWWLLMAGVAAGLGMLAKGPVALVLPGAAVGLFLLWSRRLGLLWDRRVGWASLACVLVFAPWYVWVGVETKAAFLRGFLLTHNVGRYLGPMEGHRGGPYYYPLVLLAGLAPWSAFLAPAAWYGLGRRARADAGPATPGGLPAAYRFLWCWVAVYLLFFSLAGTKLPNYVLPAYAPAALLVGRFLARWRRGSAEPGRWLLGAGLFGFGLVGVVAAAGALVVGGALPAAVVKGPRLPGLAALAATGALPVAGAAVAGWLVRRGRRGAAVAALGAAAVGFLGTAAAWGVGPVDAAKAPRPLVRAILGQQSEREMRVVCYRYFQPSLVFYAHRLVLAAGDDEQALEYLRYPVQVFLVLPADDWERLRARVRTPCRLVARHGDLYRRCDVVVVTNR